MVNAFSMVLFEKEIAQRWQTEGRSKRLSLKNVEDRFMCRRCTAIHNLARHSIIYRFVPALAPPFCCCC